MGVELSQGLAPLSPRAADHLAERLRTTLHAYKGRSKFEKTVLLQVASQLHTSKIRLIGDMFTAADRNRNGRLEKSELVVALRRLGAEQADAEAYVACLDGDGSGQVEYTEFAAACVGLLCESLRGLLWQSFCVFDVDGNGVLGREEVRAVVTHAELSKYGFPGDADRGVDDILNRIDVDRNGHISFDELCVHFLPSMPSMPCDSTAEVPSSDSPARSSASEKRFSPARPTLRDEDFAQLLDEIEADRDKLPLSGNPSRVNTTEVIDNDCEGLAFHSQINDYIAFETVSSGLAASSTEAFREAISPKDVGENPEDPATALLFGACALENEGRLTPTPADVDQELARMLEDIANGP
jgi:Ca2+-binding EF-hand superfamily protein